MPVTVEDVRTHLLNNNYPCTLTLTSVQGAVDSALTELNAFEPKVRFTSFPTVTDRQDYLVFASADPSYLGASALAVRKVYWNPGGEVTSPDIFSPSFTLFNVVDHLADRAFDSPSEMVFLRNKLDLWEKQFGAQGFEVFGQVGDPTAYLRLYPLPRQDGLNVLVEWSQRFELTDVLSLTLGEGRHLMQWVETFVAEGLARKYAQSAGTDIAGLKDSGATMSFWRGEANRLRATVLAVQGGKCKGIVDRT